MKIIKTLLASTAALTILAAAPASAALLNFKITNGADLIDSFDLNSDTGIQNSIANYVFFDISNSLKGNNAAYFGSSAAEYGAFNFGIGTKRKGEDSVEYWFDDAFTAAKPLYIGGLRLNITDADLATPGGYVVPTEGGNVVTISAVPEPATWALMLLGFGMVAGAARYRRRNTAIRFA
ncbi:PEPxxWA-CTERM sorting domain-containing protein [Sphingomonas sp. S-NIH.Pt15_0812]|uniref:PEPxxWA-CTERM sorting domain-containing protein n=1 Tax=Sphingomonas sp. S-NIH.Pt15_0812 TaxID=1920129 RepID=UPI0013DF1DB5|nr:PEPxxWA-CTERM sorting domain-containing protein [Sphingomonas sp. S-NIH.Pt15_0812]